MMPKDEMLLLLTLLLVLHPEKANPILIENAYQKAQKLLEAARQRLP